MKSNSPVEKFIFERERRCVLGCGWVASKLASSTLFQQVVILVLHVEVSLIPPRGLPTCGPPKSCKDSPLIHPFVISQCNGMTGKFVLFPPPQWVRSSWNGYERDIYWDCKIWHECFVYTCLQVISKTHNWSTFSFTFSVIFLDSLGLITFAVRVRVQHRQTKHNSFLKMFHFTIHPFER